ncbi:hypothetical protein G6F32_017424 [Rhizopus arrhizus]|nr:hypothetical protein G6F24_018396 [Rhizopus arrhizus]KAG0894406.1 hypothetical protein G6F32_017424 [Rhizopus arrhizus]
MAMIMVGANDSPASSTPSESVMRSFTSSNGKVVKAVTAAAMDSIRASGIWNFSTPKTSPATQEPKA